MIVNSAGPHGTVLLFVPVPFGRYVAVVAQRLPGRRPAAEFLVTSGMTRSRSGSLSSGKPGAAASTGAPRPRREDAQEVLRRSPHRG